MELESSTKEQIEKMIGDNEVFLFMKGNPDFPMCGFSSVASAILKKTGVEFGHCNVLEDNNISKVENLIKFKHLLLLNFY
jgi:monothiol glutaredoxin